MRIERYTDAIDALRGTTNALCELMRLKGADPFCLALSGGETAKQMFALWVDEYRGRIEWERLRFFWVDERVVAPSDAESNYGQALRLLFEPLGIAADHIHRIYGELAPDTAAMRYACEVQACVPLSNHLPRFDAILLGVGADAHTASIFPGCEALLSDSRSYAVSQHPASGQFRVTMTGRVLLNGAPLLVPILGADKEPVVQSILAGCATPATYVLSRAAEAMIYAVRPPSAVDE